MTNLTTSIGDVSLDFCVYNASGCWCTTKKELNELDDSNSGAIVSKSSTLESRDGNKEPRFYRNYYGSINSMGVPNLGYKFYMNYSFTVQNKPFIHSVIPFSENELIQIINDIAKTTKDGPYLIELNLSCPNIVNKQIVGYDFETMKEYLKELTYIDYDHLILGIKLPPYNEDWEFDRVVDIIRDHNYDITNKIKIKFVTCINSLVNGLIIDPIKENTLIKPKSGYGGIGGSYCKPIGLSNVNRFYKRIGKEIDIIGCGGVENGLDVFEYILCGASAVQVGTQLTKDGIVIFDRLKIELKNIMQQKGYTKITDFKGKLKIID